MPTIIADPFFYAVAIPAVLLMGISKAGFGAGFGAMATPLMALAVSVPQAAAIMLPVLALVDLLGVRALWLKAEWSHLRLLIPAGLVGTVIGALLFGLVPQNIVSAVVGGLTLIFLAQRRFFAPRKEAHVPPRWVGALLGVVTGFTSFVAHAGGPPVSFYMVPMRLDPIRYTATLAILFFVINASKWVPYGLLGLLDWRNLATSVVLMPFAALGVFIGLRIARRIKPGWFYQLIDLGMLLTGLKLLSDGWR